ncbi:MAG: methionine adenosyltransferase [Pseudonocardiaceae bacterium]
MKDYHINVFYSEDDGGYSMTTADISPTYPISSPVRHSTKPRAGGCRGAARQGFGHPDTLADQLAEGLSRAYSRWTLEQCGAVLRHNFDKLGLLGRTD